MRSRRGRTEWKKLFGDLETLQRQWDAKKAKLAGRGRALRAHGVAFGIEIGRRRLAEGKTDSPDSLYALLRDWERFGKFKASGSAAVSIKGIDFGVRLVIARVRRYLKALAQQE